jgi:histidyl-tRNA synthetase
LVSSVGDAESKRRFTRELANFFKKNSEVVPTDLKSKAVHDPDAAYRELLARKDPLMEKAPRTIDYLSENSRKVMMETLSFFESVGIGYTIDARLHIDPSVAGDLVFAIDATDKSGEKMRIATGGRFENETRKAGLPEGRTATALTISLTKNMRLDELDQPPSCFVVHVGDAAKLKAFTLLESLWKAHVSVTQTLMADNFREQIEKGRLSGAKYLAIIGQREALDSTIIVRNVATQAQTTLPMEKLEMYMLRGARV